MILSLDFSSRGFWVRYFMQSWFLLVPTLQSQALCDICLLCPYQAYLVSGGPSGSLSHPPPPGPRMPLPCLQCCWWECNTCIGGPRVHRAFSLSELPPGVELQTICLELPWLGIFEVEASVLSTWRLSVDAPAESAGVTGWFPFRLTGLISLFYKGLSRIFSSITVQKLNLPFLMFQITHLYIITGNIIALTLQTSVAKWVSPF